MTGGLRSPPYRAATDRDFNRRSAVNMVAGRAVNLDRLIAFDLPEWRLGAAEGLKGVVLCDEPRPATSFLTAPAIQYDEAPVQLFNAAAQ
jgi:hypothetical protein